VDDVVQEDVDDVKGDGDTRSLPVRCRKISADTKTRGSRQFDDLHVGVQTRSRTLATQKAAVERVTRQFVRAAVESAIRAGRDTCILNDARAVIDKLIPNPLPVPA
jgi:hypothetical protein